MKFSAFDNELHVPKKFVTHTQTHRQIYTLTHRHFLDIVTVCSDQPKMFKSIKKSEVKDFYETIAFFYLCRKK